MYSPNTVVTPHDLNSAAFRYMETPVEDLDDRGVQTVEAYFDTMVTGGDWLEILSRRALKRALEHGGDFMFKIKHPGEFGEIKHFGPISPDLIIGSSTTPETEHNLWREMLCKGFSPAPVTSALYMEQFGRPAGSSYDLLPEELGINRAIAHAAWADIIAIVRG